VRNNMLWLLIVPAAATAFGLLAAQLTDRILGQHRQVADLHADGDLLRRRGGDLQAVYLGQDQIGRFPAALSELLIAGRRSRVAGKGAWNAIYLHDLAGLGDRLAFLRPLPYGGLRPG
jgi:hypothetical protein